WRRAFQRNPTYESGEKKSKDKHHGEPPISRTKRKAGKSGGGHCEEKEEATANSIRANDALLRAHTMVGLAGTHGSALFLSRPFYLSEQVRSDNFFNSCLVSSSTNFSISGISSVLSEAFSSAHCQQCRQLTGYR